MYKSIRRSAPIVVVVLMTMACSKPAPTEPAQAAPVDGAAAASAASPDAAEAVSAPAVPAVADTAPAFAGKVWVVRGSSAVEPGTRYSFLGDGTLVIESAHGTPSYGKWTYENGALTMIEEGISYPTDILKLDDSTFEIRSHNPGEPVTISLARAPRAFLPVVPAQ
jgi:hypothetical protein